MMAQQKIAICFFGITRSVEHTIKSIEKNLYEPARNIGNVKIFCHFFRQEFVNNPRSNECAALDQTAYALLGADEVVWEEPDLCLESSQYLNILKYGNAFDDDGQSTRNLFHQLWSLNKVTDSCLQWNPDIVVFVRPDLHYFDSFSNILETILRAKGEQILLPNWQHWGGLNDRFAVAKGKCAIKAYGKRLLKAHDFCVVNESPLHSEKLLSFALSNVKLKTVKNRAARVRVGGIRKDENFQHHLIVKVNNFFVQNLRINAENRFLLKLMWYAQRIVFGNPYEGLDNQ